MTATEIYRLFTRTGTPGRVNGPHVEIYDDRQEFEEDLMMALLKSERANHDNYRSDFYRSIRTWFVGTGTDDSYPTTLSVQKAEKLVDGEWKELKYVLHPPRLELEE